jgi:uncharacterized protein with ParB-like and HNH nuclease domain
MKTELYSISKIFTERLFRIPDYQRGYAWTEKHLKDYWNDLYQLENERNHYVGVLTLEEAPRESLKKWTEDHWIIDSKSFAPFHVVDGQQRLTTTIILIQCICEAAGEKAVLNYTTIPEIKKKYIYDSKDEGISRSYLFGYESDNPSYNSLKVRIFNENDDVELPLEETIYTQNLENSKRYFSEKLSELNKNEIEGIFKKVTQNFLFAVYSMSDDIDVYITFETMNNRGKPLSHLELLKNRLIYLTTKFSDDEYERNKLRNTINMCWRAIYHQLGRNKKNPLDDDSFLLNHFILYFGKDLSKAEDEFPIRRLRHGYRNSFKEFLLEEKFTTKNVINGGLKLKDVNKYVMSLKNSVEVWYELLNPDSSGFTKEVKLWLRKLNRQGIHSYLPLILTFFRECKGSKERVELLKSIERYSFFMSLMGFSSNTFNIDEGMFVELAFSLSAKENTPQKVVNIINEKFNRILVDDNFMGVIKSRTKGKDGFYGWSGIRYFLYEYELSLKDKSKTYSDKLDWKGLTQDDRDFITVEHIFPRTAKLTCWREEFSDFKPNEKSKLRDSLGNLVPLSRAKNSSLSNKCFIDKKSNKDNTVGFSYGCLSENEVAQNEKWGADEILERGLKLVEFMENRWKLNLGDRYEFLNLEFMKNKNKNKNKNKK